MNTQVAKRRVVVVNRESMEQDALFSAMSKVSAKREADMIASINAICDEREAFEANRERRALDGSVSVGQSNDIRHVRALKDNPSYARLLVALKADPREIIFPQSRDGGKTSSQTSNLKAYRKQRQVAETIYCGSSDLENVVKVFTVCMYRAATMRNEVIERDFAETFLSSVEFRTIAQASEDLWSAIDEVRASHMSTGAQTQASQMIRTLVALKSAEDVRNGRSKDVKAHTDGLVMQALMRRFGIVE